MATRKKCAGRRRKSQRIYKMRGCNKKSQRKKYLGGSNPNMYLAYPSNNVPTVPNPHLAYTGGKTDAAAYPAAGPPAGGWGLLNPTYGIKGGASQKGGCGCGLQSGGSKNKKGGCCGACSTSMLGGSGNNGIPYPNGLAGAPWTTASSGWPGVDGVGGNRNYLALNEYKVDPQTAMIATGANPPFSIGGRRGRKQKGGTTSNFLSQDLINLGRQFQYGVGSVYNGLLGYSAPVNPLPWKGQLQNTPSLASIKASM
jgi:hypothetical protein